MKITPEQLSDRRVLLNIEVDGEEVERSLQKTYKDLVHRVRVPGFRPGKAPRAVLQSFLGKDVLLGEALDSLVPDVVKRAIQEQSLEAVDMPQVEIANRDPVVLKATVSLRPIVELGDYKSIRLAPEPAEVLPEKVEEAVEQLRASKATWEPVERPAAFGDLLTIDIEGKVDGRNVIKEANLSYKPTEDSSYPVPGFAKQLENMNKGQTKEFSLALPDDFPQEGLAGKQCRFKAALQEIKARNLPPLDDDFAKSIDDEYENLAMLREKVKTTLMTIAQAEAQVAYEGKLVQTLQGMARIEAPPILAEREVDHLMMDQAQALARRGVRLENYLKSIGKTAEKLREEMKEEAQQRVSRTILLHKLAEAEGIKVEDAEVDEEIKALHQIAGEPEKADEAKGNEEVRSSIKHRLELRKALGLLKEIASGKAATAASDTKASNEGKEKSEVRNET